MSFLKNFLRTGVAVMTISGATACAGLKEEQTRQQAHLNIHDGELQTLRDENAALKVRLDKVEGTQKTQAEEHKALTQTVSTMATGLANHEVRLTAAEKQGKDNAGKIESLQLGQASVTKRVAGLEGKFNQNLAYDQYARAAGRAPKGSKDSEVNDNCRVALDVAWAYSHLDKNGKPKTVPKGVTEKHYADCLKAAEQWKETAGQQSVPVNSSEQGSDNPYSNYANPNYEQIPIYIKRRSGPTQ